MLCCVRCGEAQPEGGNVCSKCGAVLPRKAPEETHQPFSLEEGRHYPSPQQSFETENLLQLRYAVEDWLEGGSMDDVRNWVKFIRQSFTGFQRGAVPGLLRTLELEREQDADNDFPHQVQYLVKKGCGLYDDGLARLEEFVSTEDEVTMEAGLLQLQEGNDNLVLSFQMVAQRQAELETILKTAES